MKRIPPTGYTDVSNVTHTSLTFCCRPETGSGKFRGQGMTWIMKRAYRYVPLWINETTTGLISKSDGTLFSKWYIIKLRTCLAFNDF